MHESQLQTKATILIIKMIVFKYRKKTPSKYKTLDKIIENALRDAPAIQGFTIRELQRITETPWPATRFQREILEVANVNREQFERARRYFYDAQNRRQTYDTH